VGLTHRSASVFDNQFANQNCDLNADSTDFAAEPLIHINLGGIFPAIFRVVTGAARQQPAGNAARLRPTAR
jgi:hypothetical protein